MEKITVQQLIKEMNDGNQLNIIDVREDFEIALGTIPGAKHIPLGDIPNRLEEFDKNKKYYLICRSGGRSGNACAFLSDQGYDVVNIDGGMVDWESLRSE